MKKLTPKKYARALYELLQEAKNETERAEVIANVLQLVAANRDTGKLDAIVAALADIYDEAAGTVRGTLVTARKLSVEDNAMIMKEVAGLVGKEAAELETAVDETVLGGFKAVFKDRIVDATVKGQLNRLKQELTQ